MWRCTKCKIEKELNNKNFVKDKRIKRGFKSYCKNCLHTQQSIYRKTKNYRTAHAKAKRKYCEDKLRRRSYNIIRRLKLEKDPCIFCGDKKSEAHHEDYNKPKEVIWVCKRCHNIIHNMGGD